MTPISDQSFQVENNQYEIDDSVNCFKYGLSTSVSCHNINNSSVFCTQLKDCQVNSNLVQGNIADSSLNFGDIENLSFEQLSDKFQIDGEIWEQELTSVLGDLVKILEHFDTTFRLKQEFDNAKSKLEYYFRMLIKLSQIFEQGDLNFNGKLIRIFDYYLHGNSMNVEMKNN